MPIDRPPVYRTRNTLLAFALKEAGCEWADPLNPCINVYDLKDLQDRGYKSTHEAAEAGYPGEVDYNFKKSDMLVSCLKAWDDEQKYLKRLEADNSLSRTYDIDPETMMRIVCRAHKTYGSFKTLWQKVFRKLRIQNAGTPVVVDKPDGGKRITFPGYKILGEHIKDEDLKHLGLK